jgi:hypothetical protein
MMRFFSVFFRFPYLLHEFFIYLNTKVIGNAHGQGFFL